MTPSSRFFPKPGALVGKGIISPMFTASSQNPVFSFLLKVMLCWTFAGREVIRKEGELTAGGVRDDVTDLGEASVSPL